MTWCPTLPIQGVGKYIYIYTLMVYIERDWERERVCVCVCVCERERERERERDKFNIIETDLWSILISLFGVVILMAKFRMLLFHLVFSLFTLYHGNHCLDFLWLSKDFLAKKLHWTSCGFSQILAPVPFNC